MLSDDEDEAFWEFYQKTSPALFRKAFRMCGGHRADAADALQEAYLKALRHWSTVAGLTDQQRHAWMVTTLGREFKQIWRAPHRNRETGSHEGVDWPSERAADGAADEALAVRDRYHQACRAIAQLSGRQGEIMIMHCIAGYEISEISEMLGISQETVRVHLHHGRRRLHDIMKAEEGSAHDSA